MNEQTLVEILNQHVPAASIPYCLGLWKQYPFHFKLRKRRISKVGDFTIYPGRTPQITVNRDADPYLFLITYIHEVAHLVVHRKYGNRIESHGQEWKMTFKELMEPVLTEEVFPYALLAGLKKHLHNPKASTFSDSKFTHLLRQYDTRQENVILLSQLPEGSVFGYHGRWFRKGKLRRTRIECCEMSSRARYLVPADAPVSHAQLSLL